MANDTVKIEAAFKEAIQFGAACIRVDPAAEPDRTVVLLKQSEVYQSPEQDAAAPRRVLIVDDHAMRDLVECLGGVSGVELLFESPMPDFYLFYSLPTATKWERDCTLSPPKPCRLHLRVSQRVTKVRRLLYPGSGHLPRRVRERVKNK